MHLWEPGSRPTRRSQRVDQPAHPARVRRAWKHDRDRRGDHDPRVPQCRRGEPHARGTRRACAVARTSAPLLANADAGVSDLAGRSGPRRTPGTPSTPPPSTSRSAWSTPERAWLRGVMTRDRRPRRGAVRRRARARRGPGRRRRRRVDHADGAAPGGQGFHVAYSDPPLNAVQRGPARTLATDLRDGLTAAGFPRRPTSAARLSPRIDLAGLNLATRPTALVECANMRDAAEAASCRRRRAGTATQPPSRTDPALPRVVIP